MYKTFFIIIFLVYFYLPSFSQKISPSDIIQSSEALLERVIPGKKADFILQVIPSDSGRDVFGIESRNNKIVLKGNNAVSIASALNWYLKYYCHCETSWCGNNLNLPGILPVVKEKVRKVSPYKYRVYFNYCTFSYSMPWWHWDRWQQEIDWMAMHGINMPLAVTGQQAVWYNTLKHFRMNDKEIRDFLVGPAYFAWQWMTNIEGWGGPLPESWIDSHIKLEQKILARERELGMTPILQGFTGYVPKILKQKYPKADIALKGAWFGVPPGSGQLNPLDTLFLEMGKTFLREEIKLYGTNHIYAADPFHEGTPPVKGDKYLKEVGETIYRITSEVDPEAMIAMQTWSLRKPIVMGIPKDKILLLDLNSSGWKNNDAFWGRPWVAGIIHNFGGKTFIGGNLEHYATNAPDLLNNPKAGNLMGIGIFPEAIGQNPIVYELASELTWWHHAPDLDNWVENYALARYGSLPPDAAKAWKILLQTVYGQKLDAPSMESSICATPALYITQASPNGGMKRDYNEAELWNAWKDLLEAGNTLKNVETYQYDLVDVARQCLADLSLPLQRQITTAYLSKNMDSLKKASQRFLALIDDMNTLLGTQPEFLLGKWIESARSWGTTEAEKNLYEKNARTLITTWGPVRPDAVQYDYSNRQWNGLLDGYYKVRWEKFLTYLQRQPDDSSRFTQKGLKMSYGRPANFANDFYKNLSEWEIQWCNSHHKYSSTPQGNPYFIADKLYHKWKLIANRQYKKSDYLYSKNNKQ